MTMLFRSMGPRPPPTEGADRRGRERIETYHEEEIR